MIKKVALIIPPKKGKNKILKKERLEELGIFQNKKVNKDEEIDVG